MELVVSQESSLGGKEKARSCDVGQLVWVQSSLILSDLQFLTQGLPDESSIHAGGGISGI